MLSKSSSAQHAEAAGEHLGAAAKEAKKATEDAASEAAGNAEGLLGKMRNLLHRVSICVLFLAMHT